MANIENDRRRATEKPIAAPTTGCHHSQRIRGCDLPRLPRVQKLAARAKCLLPSQWRTHLWNSGWQIRLAIHHSIPVNIPCLQLATPCPHPAANKPAHTQQRGHGSPLRQRRPGEEQGGGVHPGHQSGGHCGHSHRQCHLCGECHPSTRTGSITKWDCVCFVPGGAQNLPPLQRCCVLRFRFERRADDSPHPHLRHRGGLGRHLPLLLRACHSQPRELLRCIYDQHMGGYGLVGRTSGDHCDGGHHGGVYPFLGCGAHAWACRKVAPHPPRNEPLEMVSGERTGYVAWSSCEIQEQLQDAPRDGGAFYVAPSVTGAWSLAFQYSRNTSLQTATLVREECSS